MQVNRSVGRRVVLLLVSVAVTSHWAAAQAAETAHSAGRGNTAVGTAVQVTRSGSHTAVQNGLVGIGWSATPHGVDGLAFTSYLNQTRLPLAEPFSILLADGSIYTLHNLVPEGATQEHRLTQQVSTGRAADSVPGMQFDQHLRSADGALQVTWSLLLRDRSPYLRQVLHLTAAGADQPIRRVQMIDLPLKGAAVSGLVQGSPIVAEGMFVAVEHPMARTNVTRDHATAWVQRELPLRSGQSVTYSSVMGVAHPGQMRRDFQAYLERERAHPYRTFLHYNSWYDLGYFTPYDQAAAGDRVRTFGQELSTKRGVTLDSFLFDDGWDDHRSLWKFNGGFPSGFSPITAEAKTFGAAPGVWMSPWGGYSTPKQERIAFGRSAGYEVVNNGYALSGPKYYQAFRDVTMDMVKTYGVNQFKFDGTGNADAVFKGSAYDSDFAAALHLIKELRTEKPDLFINLTTGTWPSPFWLLYADSIWRGGEDDDFAGVGSDRERWITYRDAQTYSGIVQSGPLFPLNSLMLHGVIYARFRKRLDVDPGGSFRHEVRSYFGTGTQLQEMYLTPDLLSAANWDDLAEAARWSRANAAVLKDTHWVGGDPAWLQVYGWASWTPAKGILTLRNPSDRPQSITLKLQDAFEAPRGSVAMYQVRSPWSGEGGPRQMSGTQPSTFHLAPFEVLTLEATPR